MSDGGNAPNASSPRTDVRRAGIDYSPVLGVNGVPLRCCYCFRTFQHGENVVVSADDIFPNVVKILCFSCEADSHQDLSHLDDLAKSSDVKDWA